MLVEAELILKGDRERQEMELMIQTYSVMNGIGCWLGGKDFKFVNPFNDKKEDNKPQQRSREELLSELEDIKKRFNK